MPTLEHHGLVDMFRGKPPLAAHLVEMLFGLPVPEHSKVKVGEGTLDQLAPVELRADLILELRDDEDEMVLSIILEAQRGEDQIKKYSWVSYLAGERSRKKCPVVLLVVTADPKVEVWAAEKIDLGLGRPMSSLWYWARRRCPKCWTWSWRNGSPSLRCSRPWSMARGRTRFS